MKRLPIMEEVTRAMIPATTPPNIKSVILTLPAINERGFFLQPARLPVLALPERVEAVCPEALRTLFGVPVSVCPTVRYAFSRMLMAALQSRSSTSPQPEQICVLIERLFLTRVPHALQS